MEYEILQDFHGSQDGRFTEHFKAGEKVELSDYLVSCIPSDWVKRPGKIENKAIGTNTLTLKRNSEK